MNIWFIFDECIAYDSWKEIICFSKVIKFLVYE